MRLENSSDASFGSSDGRLYMVRLSDGRKVWSYQIGEGISSSAAAVDGKIVIGCDDGFVYAFGERL